MTATQTGGVLLIAGSSVFMLGAAIGVPGVFTERDPDVRLRMLTERVRMWRIAQPLYGAGPVVAAAGVGFLAGASGDGRRVVLVAASGALAAGALAWTRSLYLRGTRISEFALGTLPGWPFATYVVATLLGSALLGVGLLMGDHRTWRGVLTLCLDLAFVAAYLRFKDIPPFVFYLLLATVGVASL